LRPLALRVQDLVKNNKPRRTGGVFHFKLSLYG
jgi:hypothetical protein